MPSKGPKPDSPVSFGFKCAWYAVRAADAQAVAEALDVAKVVPVTWTRGVGAAYSLSGKKNVFFTPPLGEWTLAAGISLLASDDPATEVEPVLKKLSKRFGEAQYFSSHRVVEAHCWAMAQKGKLVRAFYFVGESGENPWNEGKPTKAERALGKDALKFPGPDESNVMSVAAAWSVDPSELESADFDVGLGLLGEVE